MTEKEKNSYFEKYNSGTHTIGRIASAIVLILLLAAPFAMGYILGEMPDLGAAAKAFLAVGLVWTVSSVVEFLIYTPMLGAGGGYLAFITGNLINMKIPCAMNSRDMVKAKSGTPESEIIATLSIATSSLVTIIVLAVGVLLLVPLQPVLENPVLQPAFECVVPALFGAMAYKYFRGNMKIAVAPLVIMSVLFVLIPSLTSSTSFMIIPSGIIAIGLAFLFFRSQQKKLSAAEATADAVEETADAVEENAEVAEENAEVAEETAEVVEETADAVEETAEVAEETAEAAEETADAVEETTEAAEETAEVVEATADAVEETADAVEETADAAEETADAVEETADAAEETADAVEETADAAEETADAAEETADAAEKTDAPAEE